MEHEKDGSEEQEPVVAPTRESLKTATDKSRADAQERLSKGRPTLTQEENDTAAIEGFVAAGEHSDDGSGPDPVVTRNLEAYKPSGAYQTRSASSARRTTPAAAPPKSE